MTAPSTPQIPDELRPYLDTITDRLLSGHAAVMVGSGFSKNATSPGSHPGFPDWSLLGDRLYERLHGNPPGPNERYLQVPALAHQDGAHRRQVSERSVRMHGRPGSGGAWHNAVYGSCGCCQSETLTPARPIFPLGRAGSSVQPGGLRPVAARRYQDDYEPDSSPLAAVTVAQPPPHKRTSPTGNL